MASFFIRVFNSEMKQQVSFERVDFSSFEEAKKYRDDLRRDYGNIGCHEVQLLMEVFPDVEEEE